MKVYIGPIWGQINILNQAHSLKSSNELVFYGAYAFFSNQNGKILSDLMYLSQQRQVHFNLSRFEESFLILAGQQPEKNYHFKRWINPFSGIFAQLAIYGISFNQTFNNVENIASKIWYKVLENKHENFYSSLQKNLLPSVVVKKIEKSIEDGSAFRELTLYAEDGAVLEKVNLDYSLITRHIESITKDLATFEVSCED